MTIALRTFGHSIFVGRGAGIDGYGISLALVAALPVRLPVDEKASPRGFYIF